MDIRTRILKAAADVYASTGFRGATTRRIAQEAGCNEITLFRHFGSKACLLHEAVRCAGMEIAPTTLPDPPRSPRAELSDWAHRQHQHLLEKRSIIRTCMGEVEEHPEIFPTADGATDHAALGLTTYLAGLKAHKLTAVDFDEGAAAAMLIGVLFADAMGRDIMPKLFPAKPEQAVTRYVDLFLRAIGAVKQ